MMLRAWWMRLRANLRPGSAERDLDEEIRFHIEQEAARHERQGIDRAEARRRALAAFGGVERAKEDYRDGRGDRPLADLRNDVLYAFRILRRNPTLALTVILTLSLGIGASVAIFSAVSAVILRPLPFQEPGRLVALWEDNVDKGWQQQVAAPANMLDWQEQVRAFSGVAGWADFTDRPILTGQGEPQVLRGASVTGGFFSVLGVRPALGRAFEERETWSEAARVVVLGHRTWTERFGGDPSIVGRSVVLDGTQWEVVGVMGPGFAFPSRDTDLWVPVRWRAADRGQAWFRRAHWIRPIARLRDGVPFEQARTELRTVMQGLERQFPETNTHMEAGLGNLQDFLIGTSRRALLVLLAATGLLLLIACANVGNLLLVRAASREREVVLRRALGASWGRIVRQALTESALLAVLGGAAGLLLGWWGTRILVALQPPGLLPVTEVQPDLRVFAFVLLVSAASAALFGIVPALWSARRPASDALKETTRGSSTGTRARSWLSTLAVVEVALAVMLTIGAGLLVRSYQHLTRVNPGFDPTGVAVSNIALPGAKYDSAAKVWGFHEALLERVRALPGVEGAALTSVPPLTAGGWTGDFSIRGRGSDGAGREARHRQVSSEYFRVMRVPILAGRAFGPQDHARAEPVTIINKSLADRFFAGQDPIGQYIAGDLVPDSTSVWRRIVGVVGNEHGASLGVTPGIDLIEPLLQNVEWTSFHVVVRSSADPSTLLRSIERAVTSVDPTLAPVSTTTMERIRAESLARDRFLAVLLTAFAAVGAMLAVVGVYGVVAQVALRRVPEMQIRLALGADARGVHWLIVRQGITLVASGVATGAIASGLLGGSIRQLLFHVSPFDPLTFAAVAVLVIGTGIAASWIPARRIVRRDAQLGLLR